MIPRDPYDPRDPYGPDDDLEERIRQDCERSQVPPVHRGPGRPRLAGRPVRRPLGRRPAAPGRLMDPIKVHQRHPSWGECSVCGRFFASGRGFDAHMTSTTSRTCRDPAGIVHRNERLVPVTVDGVETWQWQTGDIPPAPRTPPPRRRGRPQTAAGDRGRGQIARNRSSPGSGLRAAQGSP
jgi:hypothetical protein